MATLICDVTLPGGQTTLDSATDATYSVTYDRPVRLLAGGVTFPKIESAPNAFGWPWYEIHTNDSELVHPDDRGFGIVVHIEWTGPDGRQKSADALVAVTTGDLDGSGRALLSKLDLQATPVPRSDLIGVGQIVARMTDVETSADQAIAVAGSAKDRASSAEQVATDAASKVTQAVTSQDSATAQNVQSGPLTKAALDGTYARVKGRPISAYDHGVRPDVPDVRQALNTLVANSPGAQIVLAPGPYTASADNGGVTSYNRGITLNKPNTTLDLRGATMTVLPNGAGNYQLITATAPDCRIIGGVLIGDVKTHKATDGEWGHGIVATTGGDRLLVDGTYITQMWGDGVFMDGGAADVCLRSVIADGNRRQGCSITNNVRPRIEGGAYINTGVHGFTAPGAGIDVEPDPNMGHSVTDFVIIEPLLAGNMGSGLMVCEAPGATTTGSAIVRSSGNRGHGVITDRMGPGELYSVTIQADCARNGGSGVVNNVPGTRYKATVCTSNAQRGWVLNAQVVLMSPLAESNGMSGYYFDSGSAGSRVTGLTSAGNGRATNDTYPEVDIWAQNVSISTGVSSAAPSSGNRASYGWVIRPGAKGARLVGCDAIGPFTQDKYLTLAGDTYAAPLPGATS